MYDQVKVDEVIRLLATGKTRRYIADILKMSRSTVDNIATGKVRIGRRRSNERQDDLVNFARKTGHCPTHGKIKLPCVMCVAEKYRRLHPEHDWVDPLPVLNERETQQAIQEHTRGLGYLAETMPGVWGNG